MMCQGIPRSSMNRVAAEGKIVSLGLASDNFLVPQHGIDGTRDNRPRDIKNNFSVLAPGV